MKVATRIGAFLLAVLLARLGQGLGLVSASTTISTGSIVLAGLVVGGVCGFIAALCTLGGERQLARRALVTAAAFVVGSALLGEGRAALTFGSAVLGGMVAGCLGALLVCAGFGGGEGGDDD